jgi:hypothetical protein
MRPCTITKVGGIEEIDHVEDIGGKEVGAIFLDTMLLQGLLSA